MIRYDYLVRLVRECAQALARALFLKERGEYDRALTEIERALAILREETAGSTKVFTIEELLSVCREGPGQTSEKLMTLADLLREQGELQELTGKAELASQSRVLALGLYLEVIAEGLVSVALLDKLEPLIARTKGAPRPAAVLRRLLAYLETRRLFAHAEDVVFEWLASGDREAVRAGERFYERLSARSDTELAEGGLPRNEVQEGIEQFLKRAAVPGKVPDG